MKKFLKNITSILSSAPESAGSGFQLWPLRGPPPSSSSWPPSAKWPRPSTRSGWPCRLGPRPSGPHRWTASPQSPGCWNKIEKGFQLWPMFWNLDFPKNSKSIFVSSDAWTYTKFEVSPHSSVNSSASTILQPRVRIPSKPCMLSSIYIVVNVNSKRKGRK